ncbi:hypothetical protein FB45DRAFT_874029 [Roridomyces roridus]|uniref:Uncharacterized protein n=1 Tax=Roridomyces roridus TaxID=1738132 RepID=A0AAD7FBV5_9AGAR|nr:hypothetical protein FB45DRAFT_874029 [Roridomyces roridus]
MTSGRADMRVEAEAEAPFFFSFGDSGSPSAWTWRGNLEGERLYTKPPSRLVLRVQKPESVQIKSAMRATTQTGAAQEVYGSPFRKWGWFASSSDAFSPLEREEMIPGAVDALTWIHADEVGGSVRRRLRVLWVCADIYVGIILDGVT